MKTLQKRLLAISLIIIIIAISSVNSLIVLADRRPQRDNISLNEVKTVTLYTNTQTYYFTPDESCYYIIETFSNKPTHLKISNVSSTGNIESSGVNAMIEVKSIQSGQWKIYLQFVDKNESEGGEVSIQIRKHTLSMFGYSDGSNSSLPDLQVPSEKFNNLYHIVKYENCPSNVATELDTRGLSALNSEITFFTGHGYNDGSGIVFYNAGNFSGDITIDTSINMDKTKIAMWSACYSAKSDNSFNMSFAEYSVRCGAQAAVGFEEAVSFSSAKTFTDKFFTMLSEGATVNEAAEKGAAAVIWAWDSVKNYLIFGDRNTKIANLVENLGTFSLNNYNCDFLVEELNNTYSAYLLGENEYRYYELINGYESNNYIDITKENGKIVSCVDNRSDYTEILEINENYLTMGIAQSTMVGGEKYTLKRENDEHIVYYNFSGIMTPVKISCATYLNSNYESIIEYDCLNLFNGEKINYSELVGG